MKNNLNLYSFFFLFLFFQTAFANTATPNQMIIDFEMPPFEKTERGQDYLRRNAAPPPIQDRWGYPMAGEVYRKKASSRSSKSSAIFRQLFGTSAFASDNGPLPGQVNCRADTTVTGYFKAYFEDVALGNSIGYAHPTLGAGRRQAACAVLIEMANLLRMTTTTTTPDIIFGAMPPEMPLTALAAASAYYQANTLQPGAENNGFLHRHIISRMDPTTQQGGFDAVIYTNFSQPWSVDSNLNNTTYDFPTVLRHEILHALGFATKLPAVISTTGVPVDHHGFDEFLYANQPNSTSNRFFSVSGLLSFNLQVPVGAPSSWFVNNVAIYRGRKNFPTAPLDGIRPLFSPPSWLQGSSLSHFDSDRAAVGTVYVMHPSLSPGVTKLIHSHESEVLCHLGYQVAGMPNCDVPTPSVQNDQYNYSGPNYQQCLIPQANDTSFSGGNLVISSLQTLSFPTGSQISYFAQNSTCSGTGTTNPSNARSILVTLSNSNSALLTYTVRDTVSNRISDAALIAIQSQNCPVTSPNEHVCNGNFELGLNYGTTLTGNFANAAISMGQVPFWYGPSDGSGLVAKNLVGGLNWYYNFPGMNAQSFFEGLPTFPAGVPPISLDMVDNGRWAAVTHEDLWWQSGIDYPNPKIATALLTPLIPGQQYRLAFDVAIAWRTPPTDFPSGSQIFSQGSKQIRATLAPQSFAYPWSDFYNSSSGTNAINLFETNVNISQTPNTPLVWNHREHLFTATQASTNLMLHSVEMSGGTTLLVFFDNVSLKRVIPSTQLSGAVYNDLNLNGIREPSEPGIGGVTIGVFAASNSTQPIATTVTNNAPGFVGQYSFSDLPQPTGGAHFIAMMPESSFPTITQPTSNSALVGYNRAIAVPFVAGSTITNRNFGVVLSNQLPDLVVTTDLKWITGRLMGATVVYGVWDNVTTFGNGTIYSNWADSILVLRIALKNAGALPVTRNTSNWGGKLVVASNAFPAQNAQISWMQSNLINQYGLANLVNNGVSWQPWYSGQSLLPGQTRYLYVLVKTGKDFPYLANFGPHTMRFSIDQPSQVQESNEVNNTGPLVNFTVGN